MRDWKEERKKKESINLLFRLRCIGGNEKKKNLHLHITLLYQCSRCIKMNFVLYMLCILYIPMYWNRLMTYFYYILSALLFSSWHLKRKKFFLFFFLILYTYIKRKKNNKKQINKMRKVVIVTHRRCMEPYPND